MTWAILGLVKIMPCSLWVQTIGQMMLIIIISDLEGSQEDIILGIKKLRSYGHSVMIITPFSPWFEAHELELSPSDKAIAEAISEEMMEHIIEIKPKLEGLNASLIYVGPDDFLTTVLNEYAKARKAGKGE